jgi:predicted nucleic acid-binding protein
VPLGVIDAGVAISWIQGRPRSRLKIDRLFESSRAGRHRLILSMVNLAEVLKHTARESASSGVDVVVLLESVGVRLHLPDEAIARRVATLRTSLADGFAAATALELNARLHTTDAELVRQLSSSRLPVSVY